MRGRLRLGSRRQISMEARLKASLMQTSLGPFRTLLASVTRISPPLDDMRDSLNSLCQLPVCTGNFPVSWSREFTRKALHCSAFRLQGPDSEPPKSQFP